MEVVTGFNAYTLIVDNYAAVIRCMWIIMTQIYVAAVQLLSKARAITFPENAAVRAEINSKAEQYFQQYGNSVLRLAYSYVHNMTDAEDILQETLIRVLKANPQLENAAHEKAYILKTAANVAKNHIEYCKLRETDELSEELIADEREDLSFVWEAVKTLPDTARDVLYLHFHEGYKTAEIAKILKRSDSTVRSDLKRAKERLREILKEEYDFE